MKPLKTEIAFATPWFELLAKTMRPGEGPWYSLRIPDYTPGLELVTCTLPELRHAILSGEFDHALHVAGLMQALLLGKLG